MINLFFLVNKDGLKYFKSILNKNTDLNTCMRDSKNLCRELNNIRNKSGNKINQIIENFFGKTNYCFKVEVFPKYFFLGAINIENGIIVLGQPSRSQSFYLGILLHEFIHFILKNKNINRFIEEIICFLFERMFILEQDKINIDDFQYDKSTDDFHKYAIIYSKKFYNTFLGFYKDGEIDGLIDFIDKNIDNDKKQINIKNNLAGYLTENG
ncbi:hypothetical protein K9M48_04505 [Candidatus Gracilibacteria bacterium]|nr:hypothetical protein [Candidatus Gracilibacteria bacterium]